MGLASSSYPAGINDFGQVIGSTGDVLNAPFLWSPAAPNNTAGTVSTFGAYYFGSSSTLFAGFNNYGQIASYFSIWTPSTPNGTTGAINSDARLAGITAINDYGQAIIATSPTTITLFTPATAHGDTGTYIAITGLPGATSQHPIAINNSGAILGTSCISPSAGVACVQRAFLWSPASPHGSVGNAVEIALPAGYSSIYPSALNDFGQAVGAMRGPDGLFVPFLYTAGTLYDLSLVNTQLKGVSSPSGINNSGQIVVGNSEHLYLLTPGAGPPPQTSGTVAITIDSTVTSPNCAPQSFTVSGAGCSAGSFNTPQTLYWTPERPAP
jgi:uncharacterized membrane protein